MAIEDIINQYTIASYLTEKNLLLMLNNEKLRINTIEYLRKNRNRNFANDFLKLLINKREKEDFEIASVENIMYASYIVGLQNHLEDAELIWKAKNIDFDMYFGLDIQLMVFAGVEKTINHFASLQTEKSLKAVEYLKKCDEADNFYTIDHYFSPEQLPWWV